MQSIDITAASEPGERPGASRGRLDPALSLTHTLREAARHGGSAVLLCSFQKEESVLLDELLRLRPGNRQGRAGS